MGLHDWLVLSCGFKKIDFILRKGMLIPLDK
jgi:hypothetical protein